MTVKYSYAYLKDPRALAEIRKHKWYLSQGAEREIGFATAALDWIEKYGEAWKNIHVKELKNWQIFLERRKFRRFNVDGRLTLIKNGSPFFAKINDLNYFGLSCRTSEYLYRGNSINIDLTMVSHGACELHCNGIVERCLSALSGEYELFLRFDEAGQQQIEHCSFFNVKNH